MEPEGAEAVLETIWDLHDKVSDTIHALSRAHFLRTVRRRAGGKPAGVVHVKGVNADGDEAADLNAVAEEARSLHAIRAALEDLEDQFECFLAVCSQQQAGRDIALARLQQSHIMLAIRLKEHHGSNHKVIDEALDFVHNVDHDFWSFLSVNKPEKSRSHSGANRTEKRGNDSNFLGWVVSSSLDVVRNSCNIKNIGGFLGNSAVFAVGMITMLQLRLLASGEQRPSCGKYSYRRINGDDSSRSLAGRSRMGHLDVFLAKS
ncbi:plastid division protein PDV1-like [Hordeum vulgare]|uniref:Plastid division protein PDV1 n=1 Tax=Hordeum vulgare subsp. vulgare TaxID=112509 RepID=A0A8I6XKR8_HORVV|nr:plastid division protein PDV1 [Hordeum vulgare subsp. vulgare]KAE8809335.1 plastid division protein PDV1-like [Hordeum vulgare]